MKNWSLGWKIAACAVAALILLAGLFLGFLHLNHYQIEMALEGEEKITLEYGQKYEEPGAAAALTGRWHLKDGRPLEVKIDGKVDEKKLGSYTLTYSAKVPHRAAQLSRVVTIVDTKVPAISLKGEEKITLEYGAEYKEPGFTAKDNYDGDLTKAVKTEGKVDSEKAGTYSLIYSVIDSSGNIGAVKREIEVKKKVSYSQSAGSAGVVDKVTVLPGEKTVYLTFDDGPGVYTAKLLDILKKYNVKATFFVNNHSGYNHLLTRMANEGHAIGLHTASHTYRKVYASEEAFFAELETQQKILVEKTGKRTNLIRFPGGSSNTISRFNPGIMTRLTKAVTEKGYRYFDWNVSSGDAGETESTAQVARNVIRGMSGQRVSVVLQHDIKGFSVNAVEEIIKWGQANGYKFAACSDTSFTAHHGVNN